MRYERGGGVSSSTRVDQESGPWSSRPIQRWRQATSISNTTKIHSPPRKTERTSRTSPCDSSSTLSLSLYDTLLLGASLCRSHQQLLAYIHLYIYYLPAGNTTLPPYLSSRISTTNVSLYYSSETLNFVYKYIMLTMIIIIIISTISVFIMRG